MQLNLGFLYLRKPTVDLIPNLVLQEPQFNPDRNFTSFNNNTASAQRSLVRRQIWIKSTGSWG